jgi:5-formyltetrahydrofolate cyclo-ligase
VKNKLRREKIAAREALSAGERQAKSEEIARHIAALPEFQAARTVMLYRGIKGEVRLDHLTCLAPHKRYAYPLCRDGGKMLALIPEDVTAFKPGPFGIPEPDPSRSEETEPEEIDLVICPCTSFDDAGRRLGMGGGYYDRFLPRCTRAHVIAAAFACQRAEELPEEPHDVRMELVVTEEDFE